VEGEPACLPAFLAVDACHVRDGSSMCCAHAGQQPPSPAAPSPASAAMPAPTHTRHLPAPASQLPRPVTGLARSVAAGYAQRGVRINCVAPGLTRTRQTAGFTQAGSPQEAASRAMHPLKQLAEPGDIASALEFFMRPDNSFITGQVGVWLFGRSIQLVGMLAAMQMCRWCRWDAGR
jgi:hypothetical protein